LRGSRSLSARSSPRGSRDAPWHDGLHSPRGSRSRDTGKAEARHPKGRKVPRRAALGGPRERNDRERVLRGRGDSEMRRGTCRRGSRNREGSLDEFPASYRRGFETSDLRLGGPKKPQKRRRKGVISPYGVKLVCTFSLIPTLPVREEPPARTAWERLMKSSPLAEDEHQERRPKCKPRA
jgi:hypothetical protein